MRICHFEDQQASRLEPLATSRPVFDLLCGHTSLAEKQARYFRAGERRVAPGTASPRGGWRQRMAALEAERGNLTVSNILAVLFDYRKDEELERAVKWQRFHKSLPYHSAYAIGINPRGRIITGAAWNRRNEQFASDAAMDWCTQKAEKNTCRIVMTNDLRRKEFLDVLKQLAERDYPALRHDVLQLRVERPA